MCDKYSNNIQTVISPGPISRICSTPVIRKNPGGLNFYAFQYTAQREDNDQFVGIGGDLWKYYLANGRLPYSPK